MSQEFIMNGVPSGSLASTLISNNFDLGCMRPYVGEDNRHYITVNEEPRLVSNAVATLTREAWLEIDRTVQRVARERLRFVADIQGAGLVYNVPNGFGRTSFETTKMGDINDATISMDANRRGDSDRMHFDITNIPLPIVHRDFELNSRAIAISRNGGAPLDTTMIELATRKVAERLEDLFIGNLSGYTYGGGTLYGVRNFPGRLTKTNVTIPTGLNNETVFADILAMRQSLYDDYYFGPYMLYFSPVWDRYLDGDFKTNSDKTLRQRILEVEGIAGVRTLDRLSSTNYQILMIQMTPDVIRAINGMQLTTVQWESNGGFTINFKVMAIMVPQVRNDLNNNCGIIHGTTA